MLGYLIILIFLLIILLLSKKKKAPFEKFSFYNEKYNMAFSGYYSTDEKRDIYHVSQGKHQYIEELKLKVILFLNHEQKRDYGYLKYQNKNIKVNLTDKDRAIIHKMLLNMNSLAHENEFNPNKYIIKNKRCNICHRSDLCKNQ